MCNLNTIGSWIIAAQIAALAAAGCLFAAILGNNTLVAVFASTGPMIFACVFVLVAIIALGYALALAASCGVGPCAGLANTLSGLLLALFIALSVLLGGILFSTWGSAVPFFGAASIAALFWALSAQILLWPAMGAALVRLAACRGSPSLVPGLVALLAGILALALIVVVGKLYSMPERTGVACIYFLRC